MAVCTVDGLKCSEQESDGRLSASRARCCSPQLIYHKWRAMCESDEAVEEYHMFFAKHQDGNTEKESSSREDWEHGQMELLACTSTRNVVMAPKRFRTL